MLRHCWLLACGRDRRRPLNLPSPSQLRVTPEQERFFEEKVRPLLATNCLECHGAKKQESGLRLDSRQAVIDGGDSGERAVVPGDPDRSLLVKAINHVGDYPHAARDASCRPSRLPR